MKNELQRLVLCASLNSCQNASAEACEALEPCTGRVLNKPRRWPRWCGRREGRTGCVCASLCCLSTSLIYYSSYITLFWCWNFHSRDFMLKNTLKSRICVSQQGWSSVIYCYRSLARCPGRLRLEEVRTHRGTKARRMLPGTRAVLAGGEKALPLHLCYWSSPGIIFILVFHRISSPLPRQLFHKRTLVHFIYLFLTNLFIFGHATWHARS